jgi:FKBP-type peptidyl-prolyl cis-trans isomerase
MKIGRAFMFKTAILLATLALTGTAVLAQSKTSTKKAAPAARPITSGPRRVTGEPTRTASGLEYWNTKIGTGPTAVAGQKIKVHYTGWLTSGKKFDSSVNTGRPFEFVLGAGQVIKGWDEGVAGMKVGGKRQLRIPPQLAYGEQGYPGAIPPHSTLIFDVELVAVQ